MRFLACWTVASYGEPITDSTSTQTEFGRCRMGIRKTVSSYRVTLPALSRTVQKWQD